MCIRPTFQRLIAGPDDTVDTWPNYENYRRSPSLGPRHPNPLPDGARATGAHRRAGLPNRRRGLFPSPPGGRYPQGRMRGDPLRTTGGPPPDMVARTGESPNYPRITDCLQDGTATFGPIRRNR